MYKRFGTKIIFISWTEDGEHEEEKHTNEQKTESDLQIGNFSDAIVCTASTIEWSEIRKRKTNISNDLR